MICFPASCTLVFLCMAGEPTAFWELPVKAKDGSIWCSQPTLLVLSCSTGWAIPKCYIFGLLFMPTICRLSLGLPHSFYLDPFTKVLTLIIVLLYRDLLYLCVIQSDSSLFAWYHLLQVQLSLIDAHWPLLSFTYTSIYDEEYINCTTRTLGP